MPQDPLLTLVQTLVSEAVRDEVQAAVEAALTNALPGVIRRAALPPYLTKAQLVELTGWSARKVDYLREKRRLPFTQHGRKVLFATADVEAFLAEGHVSAQGSPRRAQEPPRAASGGAGTAA